MNQAIVELVGHGVRIQRRSSLWWGIGIAALCLTTAGFWPSLEGSAALASFDDMEMMLEAFGAQNLGTAAGYLDGQMYAVMLPLLLSGLAIATVTSLTSGEEDSGRLEIVQALPVSRSAIWLSRWLAAIIVVAAITLVTGLAMLVSLPIFSLDEAGGWSVLAATLGCAILAIFHAAVGFAAAGFGARRGSAVAVSVSVLVVGYVLGFLAPLVEGLRWIRRCSPWYWALGTQPVSNGLNVGWVVLLMVVSGALVWCGAFAVNRRDMRSV